MNNIMRGFLCVGVALILTSNTRALSCEQGESKSYRPRDYFAVLNSCTQLLEAVVPTSPLLSSMSIEAWRLQSLAIEAELTKTPEARERFVDEINSYYYRMEGMGLCRQAVKYQFGGDQVRGLYKKLHDTKVLTPEGKQHFSETVQELLTVAVRSIDEQLTSSTN